MLLVLGNLIILLYWDLKFPVLYYIDGVPGTFNGVWWIDYQS